MKSIGAYQKKGFNPLAAGIKELYPDKEEKSNATPISGTIKTDNPLMGEVAVDPSDYFANSNFENPDISDFGRKVDRFFGAPKIREERYNTAKDEAIVKATALADLENKQLTNAEKRVDLQFREQNKRLEQKRERVELETEIIELETKQNELMAAERDIQGKRELVPLAQTMQHDVVNVANQISAGENALQVIEDFQYNLLNRALDGSQVPGWQHQNFPNLWKDYQTQILQRLMPLQQQALRAVETATQSRGQGTSEDAITPEAAQARVDNLADAITALKSADGLPKPHIFNQGPNSTTYARDPLTNRLTRIAQGQGTGTLGAGKSGSAPLGVDPVSWEGYATPTAARGARDTGQIPDRFSEEELNVLRAEQIEALNTIPTADVKTIDGGTTALQFPTDEYKFRKSPVPINPEGMMNNVDWLAELDSFVADKNERLQSFQAMVHSIGTENPTLNQETVNTVMLQNTTSDSVRWYKSMHDELSNHQGDPIDLLVNWASKLYTGDVSDPKDLFLATTAMAMISRNVMSLRDNLKSESDQRIEAINARMPRGLKLTPAQRNKIHRQAQAKVDKYISNRGITLKRGQLDGILDNISQAKWDRTKNISIISPANRIQSSYTYLYDWAKYANVNMTDLVENSDLPESKKLSVRERVAEYEAYREAQTFYTAAGRSHVNVGEILKDRAYFTPENPTGNTLRFDDEFNFVNPGEKIVVKHLDMGDTTEPWRILLWSPTNNTFKYELNGNNAMKFYEVLDWWSNLDEQQQANAREQGYTPEQQIWNLFGEEVFHQLVRDRYN